MNSYESRGFAEHIIKVNQRTEVLYRTAKELPWQQPRLVIECLGELQVALEELRVAEEELRRQNEELIATRQQIEAERRRYQDLFEFAPDGYLLTDLQGTMQEANRAAAQLFNITQKYLIGKPLINFVPEDRRRIFRMILNQLPQVNRLQEWELVLCGRDGTKFEAALTVETTRDGLGKAIGLRWLLRDVSARKAAESQLQQVQLKNLQLVEADRLKSQFLAAMSHELRTPMNAILGFSNLLLHQFYTNEEPELATMAKRILHNGKHLMVMIEEILDYSRLQANRLDLHPSALDLGELAHATLEELRSLADQKLLDLQIRLMQPSLLVFNDGQRLRQVLTNLLSNAIKFTDAGSVVLEIRELPQERIRITVQDTGCGIALEDQEHIFQEFWQVNQTTTRRHSGTGLGLAITRALVELMQGSITVDSQLGKGSLFQIELPREIRVDEC